jgi:tetratricopeptide (TPR) repeat protein
LAARPRPIAGISRAGPDAVRLESLRNREEDGGVEQRPPGTLRCPKTLVAESPAKDLRTMRVSKLSAFAAAALIGFAYGISPALAIGSDSPSPPPPAPSGGDTGGKKGGQQTTIKKKKRKSSQQEFLDGYRYAYALIQDGQYEGGIVAMHALGHDEHPDVANYIGYSYRKLGQYELSKVWYEKALAADPRHARTWSYYGMWHAEQGNRLMAEHYLEKIKLICGNADCKEYRMLKDVIDGNATY